MAPSQTTVVFLLFSVIIGVLAISATARPCKTIFFITSSSSYPTTITDDDHHHNPQLTFFITEIHRTTSFTLDSSSSSDDAVSVSSKTSSSSFSSSSVRDITLDILSVIGSLLFGVGCGALTAVTLFLITRRGGDDEEDEEEENDSGDDISPNGYAAIPTNATKEVPPSADEIDAMKA